MADKVYLHIGLPKCGTTYIQTVLWSSQQRLADAGILLPGERMFHHNLAATHARSQDPAPRAERVWRRLVKQTSSHPGTAILTNEWFVMADAAGAARTIAAFAGAEVHVVVTARDLTGLVPAAWQEQLKLGHGQSLDDLLAELDEPTGRWSWATLDPGEVLARWDLPPDRVHVVTLPASRQRPHEFWERFASTVGIPEGVCELDAARPNESLGVVSARLLQQLGPRLREAVRADDSRWTQQYRWLRRYLAHELLVPRRGAPIALRPHQWEAVRLRAQAAADRLRERGYDIVGDLADLTALERNPDAVVPDDVSEGELLEASYDLTAALLRQLHDSVDDQAPLPGGL